MMNRVNRRTFLEVAGTTIAWGCTPTPAADVPTAARSSAEPESVVPSAPASATAVQQPETTPEQNPFEDVERRIGGRVGVYAFVVGTDLQVASRADERFAMCSTFKWPLVAAVLARIDRGELSLDEEVPFGKADLLEYAPVTRERVGEGKLTLGQLAQAAIDVSDNTAANLLLDRVGGPSGLTAFARQLGDDVTRLDRNEPMLNTNLADDPRDTTSPRAMARLVHATMSSGLSPAGRTLLRSWLIASKTGGSRLRAGLPGLVVGDKTGTGNRGACNDVAMVWPADGAAPWVITSYLSDSTTSLDELNAAHVEIAQIVYRRFSA